MKYVSLICITFILKLFTVLFQLTPILLVSSIFRIFPEHLPNFISALVNTSKFVILQIISLRSFNTWSQKKSDFDKGISTSTFIFSTCVHVLTQIIWCFFCILNQQLRIVVVPKTIFCSYWLIRKNTQQSVLSLYYCEKLMSTVTAINTI